MTVALGIFALFVQGNASLDTETAREFGIENRAVPTGPLPQWGIYQIYWGAPRFRDALANSLEEFDAEPDYIMFYRDMGRGFPHVGCEIIRGRGAVPMLSLELWRWGHRGTRGKDDYLEAICDGRYDEFFHEWARDARDFGTPVVLRFGFEMNGDWFPWGNRPEEFITAWRRAHDIFEEERADNVIWAWCPNNVSIPRDPGNGLEIYYPGDEVVDWIGLDGYNFGEHHDQWHTWESFDDVFGPALALCDERWPHKPIFLAEFGCAPGEPGQKAQWIRDAYQRIVEHPRLFVAVWFNLDTRNKGEPNWRISSDAGALDAFNETFAKPR